MRTCLHNILELIDIQIEWTEKQILAEQAVIYCSFKQEKPGPIKLQWKGSSMELVELVYALHEADCFGNTPLKAVFEVVGKIFDCEIANYYRLFWDVRNRINDDRTYFLNKLRQALSDKLIRMDSGGRH